MISTPIKASLLFLIILISSAHCVKAQIVITDFSITDNSVALSFTGTLAGPEPFADHRQLFLLPNTESLAWSNPTIDAGAWDSPNSSTGSISVGSRSSSTIQLYDNGIPALNLIFSPSGGPNIGDTASGTLESTWDIGTFDPAIAQSDAFSLYWGRTAIDIRGGTFQSTITPVPEPAESVLAVSFGILVALLWRRHRLGRTTNLGSQN